MNITIPKIIPEYKVSLVREKSYNLKQVSSSLDVGRVLAHILPSDLDREHFVMLGLNNANKIIGAVKCAIGGIASLSMVAADILRPAIVMGANGIILSHNHLSGDCSPSNEDIQFTAKIKEACKVVGINLLDHVIVSDNQHYSFVDMAIL